MKNRCVLYLLVLFSIIDIVIKKGVEEDEVVAIEILQSGMKK